MFMWIGILSILAFIASPIIILANSKGEKGKFKKILKTEAIIFVVFISCIILDDTSGQAAKRNEQTRIEAEQKKQEEAKKAEEKAQKEAAEKAKAKKEAEPKTPAQIAKENEQKEREEYQQWINNQFSAWDGSHIQLVKMIKERMNNPESFKHVETTYEDKGFKKGITVLMTYRGTNAYGGIVTNQVIAEVDYEKNRITWKEVQ